MIINVLAIDPQEAFCNPVLNELYVPGAEDDCARTAVFISKMATKIDSIICSGDLHQYYSIFFKRWWRHNRDGRSPADYEIIRYQDIYDWYAVHEDWVWPSFQYVRALNATGRYPLQIWPDHAIEGTQGANIMPNVATAFREWSSIHSKNVDYVWKGRNPLREHYSILEAEVPDNTDPATQLNVKIVEAVEKADLTLIVGQALDKCVASSIRGLRDAFKDKSSVGKLVLLTDTTSPVPTEQGIADAKAFIAEMVEAGMQVSTTNDFSA